MARFCPLAIIATHNDLDIAPQVVRKLLGNGIAVHIVRLARFDQDERARGWHIHYDQHAQKRDRDFIWDPARLTLFPGA